MIIITDYYFDMRPHITDEMIEHLKYMLPNIKPNQTLTIVMENADAHEAAGVFDLLDRNGFDYQPKGGHGNEAYNINAVLRS